MSRITPHQREFLKLEQTIAKLVKLELLPAGTELGQLHVMHGRGCEKCQDTGYLGRVAIYELLPMTDEVRTVMQHNPTPKAIGDIMEREGRLTMLEDGLLKVFTGVTSLDEVLRATK